MGPARRDQRRRPRRRAGVRRPPRRRRRASGSRSSSATCSRPATRRPRRVATLARLPVHAPYNLTLRRRDGRRRHRARRRPTARRASAPRRSRPTTRARRVARARAGVRSVERERALLDLLPRPGRRRTSSTPSSSRRCTAPTTTRGFGTLYTAVYRPPSRRVEYRWPGARWRQSLDAFETGIRTVRLPGTNSSNECSHDEPGQEYSTRPSAG